MQTLVGEAAINNVLMAHFAGTHKIPVNGLGNITLTVNNIGIDIQNKDDIVVGYDLVITSDFLSDISKISKGVIKGEIPFKNAITIRESNFKDAYIAVMTFGNILESILSLAGITDNVISNSIKSHFVDINGEIELWRQQYSVLLNNYVNNFGKKLDLSATNVDLSYHVNGNDDNIEINLKMDIESEKQYFRMEDNKLFSNKKFSILDITLFSYGHQLFGSSYQLNLVRECSKLNMESGENNLIDLTKACWVDSDVNYTRLRMVIRVKTMHGGIVSLEYTIQDR